MGASSALTSQCASTVIMSVGFANVGQLVLDGRLVEHLERQIHEQAHTVHDVAERHVEGAALFIVGAFHRRRIFKSPVRRNRLAWPDRAYFAGRLVADSDDEIHWRG